MLKRPSHCFGTDRFDRDKNLKVDLSSDGTVKLSQLGNITRN